MVSRIVKLSGSFTGGSLIVHSSSGDSSTIDLSSYSGPALIETTIDITDGNDYWFEYNISSTDYVDYVSISNEPSLIQKSSASSLDSINHITSQGSMPKISSSELEVYFTTLTTSIPTKTQTSTILKTSFPFTTSLSQAPDYTDISSNIILEGALLTVKASKYREYISRLIGIRKVIANITDNTKVLGSNLESKNVPKPTKRYLTVNIQGSFPSRKSYIHIISNTGERRTVGLSNYQRTGPEYLLNFTTEPVSYQKNLNIDKEDTLDSLKLQPTTVPDISPIESQSIPIEAVASNITVAYSQDKINISSKTFSKGEQADLLSLAENTNINSAQTEGSSYTTSNVLSNKQSSDGYPIDIPRTISSDSNITIGFGKPLNGTHIGKDSGWKIIQKNPSEYTKTGPILHQDNVEVHPYSINIELTVSNTNKQWLETLEKDAQKLTSNVDFRGESLIADTSNNTNTYKLYPKELQSPGIQEGEYHVQEYSETAKGSNSELYQVSIKFIRSFSYESINDYSDNSKYSSDWKFSINSSEIYTQKVGKTFDISGSRQGVESYKLDVVLSGKQASIFTNLLSNTKGLTFINSRDGPNYTIDNTKQNKNKIYIEPPENANFRKGIYSVHNWKSDISGEYHSVELSLSFVYTGTIQSSFEHNQLTADSNTFAHSLARLMDSAPTVAKSNPLTPITNKSSEEDKTITENTLKYVAKYYGGAEEVTEAFLNGSPISSRILPGGELLGEYKISVGDKKLYAYDRVGNYILEKDIEGVTLSHTNNVESYAYTTIEHSESTDVFSGNREMRQYRDEDPYGVSYLDDADPQIDDLVSNMLGNNFVYVGEVGLNVQDTPDQEYKQYEANDGETYNLRNLMDIDYFGDSDLTIDDLNGRIPIADYHAINDVRGYNSINPPGTDTYIFFDDVYSAYDDDGDDFDMVITKVDKNLTEPIYNDDYNVIGREVMSEIRRNDKYKFNPSDGIYDDGGVEVDVPDHQMDELSVFINTFGKTSLNVIDDNLSTYTINNMKLQTYEFVNKSIKDLDYNPNTFVPYIYDFDLSPIQQYSPILEIEDIFIRGGSIVGTFDGSDNFITGSNSNIYTLSERKELQTKGEDEGFEGFRETTIVRDESYRDIQKVHVDDNIIILIIEDGTMNIIDKNILQSTHMFEYMTNEPDDYGNEEQRTIWYSLLDEDEIFYDEEIVEKGSIKYIYQLNDYDVEYIISLSSEEFLLFYSNKVIKMYIDQNKAYIKDKIYTNKINNIEYYNNKVYMATGSDIDVLLPENLKIRRIDDYVTGTPKYIKVEEN